MYMYIFQSRVDGIWIERFVTPPEPTTNLKFEGGAPEYEAREVTRGQAHRASLSHTK